MITCVRKSMSSAKTRACWLVGLGLTATLASTRALAQDNGPTAVETSKVWHAVNGSDCATVTEADRQRCAERHRAALERGPLGTADTARPGRTPQINIIYHVDGSVPPAAIVALGMAEAYLESLFGDPITVDISVAFQDLPGIPAVGMQYYVCDVPYASSRAALVGGMDSDDVIQSCLPVGDCIPVRYDGGSDTITCEPHVDWTRANYKATVGTVSGYCGYMVFSTQYWFDYDPTDGISAGCLSFVDLALHETGHVLGFVSGVDYWYGCANFTALDLFRFQRTDGGYDYNPDTCEEFALRPRLVSYNSPDDDHNSDLISVEYRMSDGDPWPGSHFRDQCPRIGLMGPYIPEGVSYYPNYFTSADLNMFDAIGYDYPPCEVPQFTQQPQSVNGCVGATVQMSVAVNIPNPGYQWRIGVKSLPENGHYVGTQTSTLSIVGLTLGDTSAMYNCLVTNLDDGCVAVSNYATVTVYSPVTITQHPQSQTKPEGSNVIMSVTATGDPPLSYQWRRNGVNLTNGGNIFGATSANLMIISVLAAQSGYYDCQVTNLCGTVTSNVAHLCVTTGYGAGHGDMNCDGTVDFRDINPFILALIDCELYYEAFPDCHCYNADINCDGNIDFRDINPFVALLTQK
jgi:hypothetical protein